MDLKVEIISKTLIKPSSQTPKHPQNYKLSSFDQLAIQMHVPCFLFYPYNSTSIDDRLEQSLSNILTHIYPAAGRFSADGHSIDCFDQGVTYIKAKVPCQLSDFLNKAHKDHDLALSFAPQMDLGASKLTTTPLVVVQVTKFDCGGLALVVSTAHSVMDGFTNLKFIHEWSKVCKLGTPAKDISCFSFDLGTIFPTRDMSKVVKSDHQSNTMSKSKDFEIVAKRFFINECAISRLRDSINSTGVLDFKPSRVEMITAMLWRALIRVTQQKNTHLRPSLLILPMNLRNKIDMPGWVVSNAFGNFAVEVPVKFIPGEAKTLMEVHDFIILVRETMQTTSALFAKASNDEIVSMASKFHVEIQEWEENEDVDVFMVSSLCKFPILEADFGWGKPCMASCGLRRSDMFWLYDTECGTGIVVQADLKQRYMGMFERDQDVMSFMTCKLQQVCILSKI